MEHIGLEPTTPTLPVWCAHNLIGYTPLNDGVINSRPNAVLQNKPKNALTHDYTTKKRTCQPLICHAELLVIYVKCYVYLITSANLYLSTKKCSKYKRKIVAPEPIEKKQDSKL